jgi:fucose permease
LVFRRKGGASANVEAATAAAYAFGGGISVYLSTRLLPQQMLYFNFTIINIGNILLLIFSSKSLTFLWIGNVLVGLGMSSTYASIYTFLEHQICVTNAIGSVFLFASGAGTAILPLFLSKLCSNPQLLIYLSLFCTQMSLIIFFALHIITNIRSKQIDMIKRQIIKSPAILLGYRRRAFSILTV